MPRGWLSSYRTIAGGGDSRAPNKSWHRDAVGNQAEESEVK